MKVISLKSNINYDEVLAYQTSDSFGEQYIKLVGEYSDGMQKTLSFEHFCEGNWIEFSKPELIKRYGQLVASFDRFRDIRPSKDTVVVEAIKEQHK